MSRKMSERQKAYRKYLLSDHWKALREAAITRYGKCCNRCGEGESIQVHHHTYRTPWETCTTDDLEVLCENCHRVEHGLLVRRMFEPGFYSDDILRDEFIFECDALMMKLIRRLGTSEEYVMDSRDMAVIVCARLMYPSDGAVQFHADHPLRVLGMSQRIAA